MRLCGARQIVEITPDLIAAAASGSAA